MRELETKVVMNKIEAQESDRKLTESNRELTNTLNEVAKTQVVHGLTLNDQGRQLGNLRAGQAIHTGEIAGGLQKQVDNQKDLVTPAAALETQVANDGKLRGDAVTLVLSALCVSAR